MQIYETTIVIDSLQKQEDSHTSLTGIENFIKNNGGNILIQEEWGKKRLAYEINRKQYGNYHHIVFESQSSLPELLEKEYLLQETILTHLTVKAESRHLEKLKQKQSEQSSAAETTEKPASTPEPKTTPEASEKAASEPEVKTEESAV